MLHVWGRGEVHTGIWWGKLKERDQLEDQGVNGVDNIRMDLQGVECGGVDWIDVAQNRDRWRALVNSLINFRVP
jgi:hypothetical protein